MKYYAMYMFLIARLCKKTLKVKLYVLSLLDMLDGTIG